MRIVALPLNDSHTQEGQLHALRALGEVMVLDYMREHNQSGVPADSLGGQFVRLVREQQPDWCWLQLQGTNVIQPDAIEAARAASPGTVFVHWTGDVRPQIEPYLASVSRVTDLTLTSAAGQVPLYLAAGAKDARYLQIGLDWREDVLGEPDWKPPFRVPDVVFCGNYYGETFEAGSADRVSALSALASAGIDVGIVGGRWPGMLAQRVVGKCTVKQQLHVYRRAKVALSVSHYNDIERYYSDRLLIALASGTAVVAKRFPGWQWEFRDCCLFYDDVPSLVAAVKSLLDDQRRREQLGIAGRAEVIARHTWLSRMLEVVAYVESIRSCRPSP